MKDQEIHTEGTYRIHYEAKGQMDMGTAAMEEDFMEFVLTRVDEGCHSELMARATVTISRWDGKTRFLIHEIASYEGEAYCCMLLDALDVLAAKKGFREIYMKKNGHSGAFWERNGFEISGTEPPVARRLVKG